MRFLLDTCVISEGRRNNRHAVRWLEATPLERSFLSVMTVGEIVHGIRRLSRNDQAGASRLQSWLGAVRRDYHGRTLPITIEVAERWGELSAQRPRPLADALIAATALAHGLAVVTRNVGDFADTGVAIVNPWEGA